MATGWMPLMGTGLAIRMDLLNEEQARLNHGQSLAKLAERGGLGIDEALAIAQRRDWRLHQDGEETMAALAKLSV